jgi:cyclohexanecarboxylate-CoA ligase
MDLLGPGSRFNRALVDEYWRTGLWRDVNLATYLRVDDETSGRPAALSVDASGTVTSSLTYEELDAMSRRVAAGLRGLGVGEGDTVAVMLPNSAEFSAVVFGILRIGAVYSGIPVTYGRREIGFMLARAGARVLITAERYGDRRLPDLVESVRSTLPALTAVVVMASTDALSTDRILFDDLLRADPLVEEVSADPFSIAQLAFTSGTTDEPKAVMNLHVTLDAVISNWVQHIGRETFGVPMVNLVMSPVGHSTGFFWGALMTALLGGTAVYLQRWQSEVGLRVLHEQHVTTMIGSPTFLIDVLHLPDAVAAYVPDLRIVAVPGAPIPRPLIPRARAQLGCLVVPAWGMTEYGIGISGSPSLPRDRVEATDGVPVHGCEVRVCDADGAVVPSGVEGDLQIRGAGLFAGYYQRPDYTEASFTSDGWFQTGDRAAIDEDGFVSLKGRTKDIVIRGGENIPINDIETLLYAHPAVLNAAVVGIPDERLGERACAVIETQPNAQQPDLAAITEFLLEQGVSKRFLPERLLVVDKMPRTMSGKIRKVELRELARKAAQ